MTEIRNVKQLITDLEVCAFASDDREESDRLQWLAGALPRLLAAHALIVEISKSGVCGYYGPDSDCEVEMSGALWDRIVANAKGEPA